MPARLRILLTRLQQKIKQYRASSWSLCLAVQARSSLQKDTCKQFTSNLYKNIIHIRIMLKLWYLMLGIYVMLEDCV